MITPYFNDNDNFILYQGNTNTILPEIKTKVDVVFADPPYFLSSQKQYLQNGKIKTCDKGEWDRVSSSDKINSYNREWLTKCRDVLKEITVQYGYVAHIITSTPLNSV